MARKRQIDPELWKSEQFVRLSLPARLLWIGLFSNADDEGRLKGSPLWLKMALFPADNHAADLVEGWLQEVLAVGLALAYEVDGLRYLCLPTFAAHQYISKPYPSKLPAPPVGMVRERSGNGSGMRNGVEVGVGVDSANEKQLLPLHAAFGASNGAGEVVWPDELPEDFRLFLSEKDGLTAKAVFAHAERLRDKYGDWPPCEKALRHAYVEATAQLQRGYRPRNVVGWMVKMFDKHVDLLRKQRPRA